LKSKTEQNGASMRDYWFVCFWIWVQQQVDPENS